MATSTESVTNQGDRSLWFHLIGIIDRPISTFEAVTKQRRWTSWALPLAIVLIALTLVIVVQSPYTAEFAREQAEAQLATLPEAQAEQAFEQVEVGGERQVERGGDAARDVEDGHQHAEEQDQHQPPEETGHGQRHAIGHVDGPFRAPAAKAGAGQGGGPAKDHRHDQRHDRQFQRGGKAA